MDLKKIVLLIFALAASSITTAQTQQRISIEQDFTRTEIRTKRVELGLEINHGVNFSGDLFISFGSNTNSLTTQLVATVSSTQTYNPKTDYLKKYWSTRSKKNPKF